MPATYNGGLTPTFTTPVLAWPRHKNEYQTIRYDRGDLEGDQLRLVRRATSQRQFNVDEVRQAWAMVNAKEIAVRALAMLLAA